MRITVLLIGFLCITQCLNAQKYYTKTGQIHFEASVPSFEEVDATNKTVTAIINIETGEIAALALVQGFRFKIALMEEHFNENYAESTKFPKATFKGNLQNFRFNDLNEGKKKYTIDGEISFHGVTHKVKVEALVSKLNNEIHLNSSFSLNPEDFNIKLAKIVRNKVAETVEVAINFKMKPKS